ncbi:MAG: hypothetical protein LBI90_06600, partial [Treponema sp.]|nr:hypothetical protein [Treponema sp.]
MQEETIREPEMGLTFEKVWAMFQETDRKMQEMALETDRRMQETDRKMQETARQMKETDRKISSLGSKLGDLIEELIFPNILEKFNRLGYGFGRAGTNMRYQNARGEYIAEVDILLENGDVVLAVEVKTTLTDTDVRDHL